MKSKAFFSGICLLLMAISLTATTVVRQNEVVDNFQVFYGANIASDAESIQARGGFITSHSRFSIVVHASGGGNMGFKSGIYSTLSDNTSILSAVGTRFNINDISSAKIYNEFEMYVPRQRKPMFLGDIRLEYPEIGIPFSVTLFLASEEDFFGLNKKNPVVFAFRIKKSQGEPLYFGPVLGTMAYPLERFLFFMGFNTSKKQEFEDKGVVFEIKIDLTRP